MHAKRPSGPLRRWRGSTPLHLRVSHRADPGLCAPPVPPSHTAQPRQSKQQCSAHTSLARSSPGLVAGPGSSGVVRRVHPVVSNTRQLEGHQRGGTDRQPRRQSDRRGRERDRERETEREREREREREFCTVWATALAEGDNSLPPAREPQGPGAVCEPLLAAPDAKDTVGRGSNPWPSAAHTV